MTNDLLVNCYCEIMCRPTASQSETLTEFIIFEKHLDPQPFTFRPLGPNETGLMNQWSVPALLTTLAYLLLWQHVYTTSQLKQPQLWCFYLCGWSATVLLLRMSFAPGSLDDDSLQSAPLITTTAIGGAVRIRQGPSNGTEMRSAAAACNNGSRQH